MILKYVVRYDKEKEKEIVRACYGKKWIFNAALSFNKF